VLAQRFVTAASEKSFNNELGVPLTLCNAPDDVEAVVVEMGARGSGHIAFLCEMARPDVGVVTTVQAVHTELMGGVEQIALTKGELIESLPADGMAVLNASVPLVAAMATRSSARVVTFGDGGDVVATGVVVDDVLRPSFDLSSPWGSAHVQLGVRGVHNVDNALAAAAVGLFLGVDLDGVVAGLASGEQSPWRMDLCTTASGARVLNDAYNAAPASMAAALRSLAALPASRRVAVLGLMAELGDIASDEHRRVAALADELGIRVVAVDTDLYGVEPVSGVQGALAELGTLDPGDAVLVKASRVAGLERVAAALVGGGG
jgi:UDP-N-acetylmuramoyl-tripeptide--D-alanyl-D-alanine ligase